MTRVPLGKPLDMDDAKLSALASMQSKPSEIEVSLLLEKWKRIANAPLGENKAVLPKDVLEDG